MHQLLFLSFLLGISAGIIQARDLIFMDPPGSRLPVGSKCTAKDGSQGVCSEVRKCPRVKGTLSTNPYIICGFNGTSVIVCCPDAEMTDSETDVGPASERLIDISSPRSFTNFDCGQSTVKSTVKSISRGRCKRAVSLLTAGITALVALAAGAAAAGYYASNLQTPNCIIDGYESQKNVWPWIALLGNNKNDSFEWTCGGVLINDQWVLTAGHCLDFEKRLPTTVRLGEHNYEVDEANEEDFEISEIIRYPSYSFPIAYHDLALLKLKRKVTFKQAISPVCLPWGNESQKNLIGEIGKVTGWGYTEYNGFPSPPLLETDVTIFSHSKCHGSYSSLRHFNNTWPSGIGEETVCAGHELGGPDACRGDSGGPLIYLGDEGKYYLSGIVSRGYGCGQRDYPGIYTNILHPPHLAWIKKVAF